MIASIDDFASKGALFRRHFNTIGNIEPKRGVRIIEQLGFGGLVPIGSADLIDVTTNFVEALNPSQPYECLAVLLWSLQLAISNREHDDVGFRRRVGSIYCGRSPRRCGRWCSGSITEGIVLRPNAGNR